MMNMLSTTTTNTFAYLYYTTRQLILGAYINYTTGQLTLGAHATGNTQQQPIALFTPTYFLNDCLKDHLVDNNYSSGCPPVKL